MFVVFFLFFSHVFFHCILIFNMFIFLVFFSFIVYLFIHFCLFTCSFSCFFLFFSVPFIGFPITSQNAKKKLARVPPRRPFPYGKAALAPCRECIFSSSFYFFCLFFLICFFLIFIWGGGQIEPWSRNSQGLISRPKINKKSKLQNKQIHQHSAPVRKRSKWKSPSGKSTPPFGRAAAPTTVTKVTS